MIAGLIDQRWNIKTQNCMHLGYENRRTEFVMADTGYVEIKRISKF